MRVDFSSAATVEQYPRVSHDGTALVVLVLHRRSRGKKTVEVLRDVHGALAVKNIMDDIPRLQRSLQDRNISLGIEKLQDVLPV